MYQQLAAKRQVGFSPNTISQEALESYCRLNGITRIDTIREFEYIVNQLEDLWLENQREKDEQERNNNA